MSSITDTPDSELVELVEQYQHTDAADARGGVPPAALRDDLPHGRRLIADRLAAAADQGKLVGAWDVASTGPRKSYVTPDSEHADL